MYILFRCSSHSGLLLHNKAHSSSQLSGRMRICPLQSFQQSETPKCTEHQLAIYKSQVSDNMARMDLLTTKHILPDLVFACWKQAEDLCVSLLFVLYRYIQICNTKQYIYKTNYTLFHHSRTHNKVNIGIGKTCM